MDILILADSRAMWPREYSWPNVLQQMLGPSHTVTSYISGIDKWLASINMMEEFLLDNFPNKKFDVIIVQAGWHEGGPCLWPEATWREIITTKTRTFNPLCLVDRIEHKGKNQYLYKNGEEEESVFKTFKLKSSHVIFINMHSVRPPNDLNTEFQLGMVHQYKQLAANRRFAPSDCDVLCLPQDNDWIVSHCLPDRLHYMFHGVNYIATYLHRYINRVNKSLVSCLMESNKHQPLFNKAKKIGSSICKHSLIGDKVLLCRDLDEELVAAFWGCILYGRIPLIIQHPSFKVHSNEFESKLLRIKNSINPSLCYCDEKYRENLKDYFECPLIEPIEECLDIIVPNPKSIAFLQLSSGTTGDVKVLEVTHSQAIENCEEYSIITSLNKYSSIVSWLPLYHDMGLITSVIIPIIVDCEIHYIDTFQWLSNPISILKMVETYKATHVWWPNFVFSFLANRPEDTSKIDLSSLQFLISCSELTYNRDVTRFIERYKINKLTCNICNCYALAENVFAVSQTNSPTQVSVKDGYSFLSCGQLLQGVSVLIMSPNEEDITGDNIIGKVYIKSNTLTSKQLNEYGYYDTGDLGFIYNGELFIAGRSKDAFISFGNNIYPETVEKIIDIGGIIPGRVACIGIFDENIGTHKIFIVGETEDLSLVPQLQKEIAFKIKTLYDVSPLVFIEKPSFLVKTSSGKISRKRTGDKMIMKLKILNAINDFLRDKNKTFIREHDILYSSGILDSLEMFELVLFLEKVGISLNKASLTKDSFRIDLTKIDDIDSILSMVQ